MNQLRVKFEESPIGVDKNAILNLKTEQNNIIKKPIPNVRIMASSTHLRNPQNRIQSQYYLSFVKNNAEHACKSVVTVVVRLFLFCIALSRLKLTFSPLFCFFLSFISAPTTVSFSIYLLILTGPCVHFYLSS